MKIKILQTTLGLLWIVEDRRGDGVGRIQVHHLRFTAIIRCITFILSKETCQISEIFTGKCFDDINTTSKRNPMENKRGSQTAQRLAEYNQANKVRALFWNIKILQTTLRSLWTVEDRRGDSEPCGRADGQLRGR